MPQERFANHSAVLDPITIQQLVTVSHVWPIVICVGLLIPVLIAQLDMFGPVLLNNAWMSVPTVNTLIQQANNVRTV